MNINDALQTLSECEVVVGMDCDGNMKLIKNGADSPVKDFNDGLEMLYKLFNQESCVEYFNEAFHQDFEKLMIKHFKRMNFETREIISTREGLWASSG